MFCVSNDILWLGKYNCPVCCSLRSVINVQHLEITVSSNGFDKIIILIYLLSGVHSLPDSYFSVLESYS